MTVMIWYPISYLDKMYPKLVHPARKTRGGAKRLHFDDKNRFTFDCETSSAETPDGKKIAWVYIWMIAINGTTFYSRDWTDVRRVLDMLHDDGVIRVVYIHNLGYEFQFLRDVLPLEGVFARRTRKPMWARYRNIELRCSYFLSNMSLEKVGKNYCTTYQKMMGDLNYTLIRTPRTPLTSAEMRYCIADVLVLDEYIKNQLEKAGGKYKKIPHTSTGFVRQEYADFLRSRKWYNSQRRIVQRLAPRSMELFQALEKAYTGGITHANYLAVLCGTIENVESWDKASSYPWSIVSQKYPMSQFKKVQKTAYFRENPKYAWVALATFTNIHARGGNCIISKSKCVTSEGLVDSNGRVYYADKISVWITDVDYHNIDRMYTFDDMDLSDMWVSEYNYLPRGIVEFTLDLYNRKTKLKGTDQKDLYMYIKQLINSIYGMCVLDPVMDMPIFSTEENEWKTEPFTPDMLPAYYEKYSTLLVYQWGVWITAHSRRSLVDAMCALGDSCEYVDTDSVKITGDHAADMAAVNAKIHADNVAAAEHFGISFDKYAPKDIDGKPHEIGLFEFEYKCTHFKTLQCKRYVYSTDGKYLHATVAGAPTKEIEAYLNAPDKIEDKLKLFNNTLKLSGEFDANGKNESGKITMLYIDAAPEKYTVTDYLGKSDTIISGHCIHASGATFRMTEPPGYKAFKAQYMITEKVQKIRNGVQIV